MGKEMDSYTPEEREFNKYVVSSLLYFNEATDVTKFLKEYKWSHDKIFNMFWDVIYNNPQIFYVDYHHLRLTNFRVVGKSNIICGLTDYKFCLALGILTFLNAKLIISKCWHLRANRQLLSF